MHLNYSTILYFLIIIIISGTWCEQTEQILVSRGQSFSLDCKQDESIYFARRLGEWSEIQENDEKYSYLNLNFNDLSKENILRVTSNSARLENIGYYGCRKPTWTTTSMNRIYQLILADVQSFYWTYICYGPAGSCIRSDDPSDETLSTFEVADQTHLDLFCCASVTGYKSVNINMNQVGEIRGKIDVKHKQELDGSWVVCANQHTVLTKRSSRNQETLTCELITDNQSYSSLAGIIIMKDAITADPDIDPAYDYTPPSKGDDDDEYFASKNPSSGGGRGKLTIEKQIAIIIGSIISGLFFFGLLFCLIFVVCRKKKASTNFQTNKSNKYSAVNTYEKNRTEEESIYIEPTPLYENSNVFLRL